MSGIFDQVINYAPPSLLLGTVTYKGTWSAATNTPTLPNPPSSITNGNYYVVSAAGTQFSLVFNIGDWIISNGSAWEKVDNTDAVSSVFGRTGAVVGVSTDYSAVGITATAVGASSPSTGAFTTLSATTPLAVASGGTGVASSTGTTNVVLSGSPTITTPVIAQINDANGNETLKLASIASAVNEVTIENAATGNAVHISATGGDASVGLHLAGKGASGYVNVQDSVDATKRIMFNASGGTTNTRTMLSSTQTVDRTLSLPDATDTLVGKATTDTLTNKTITGGILNGSLGSTTPSTVAATTISASATTNTPITMVTTNAISQLSLDTTAGGATDATQIAFRRNGTAKWTVGNNVVNTGDAFTIASGGVSYASVTSTGLNSTAIGATTVSTGAFSTLTATGITTVAAGSAALPAIVSTTGTADTGLWFPAADTIAASTAGTERMRIDSSGNVGIGTTSPAGKIDIVTGPSNEPIYFRREDNGNQNVQIYNGSGGGFLAMGGSIGKPLTIQNLTANAINVIAGTNGVYLASAATSWASLSDERAKDIIESISDATNKVSSLRSVIGKYKTDVEGTRRSFLIAQDVQAVLPEAVDATNPDKLGLQYTDVIPLLVASIKELSERLAALESK